MFMRLASALGCALILVTGCRRAGESPKVKMTWSIAPQPARVGPAAIVVNLSDEAGNPVKGTRISLEGDMSHAGMAPVFAEAAEIEPGHYQGRLEFTMAGDWVVLMHMTLAGGQTLERQVDVKGVRPN
jgi:hypothetical protein